MSATNHTTNYELPIFVGTDKPAWLVDWNSAMTAIDTAIHTAEGKADQAGTDIGGIESSISTINSTLTSINNAVSQLRIDTNANTGSINTITSLIGNGEPTTTDKTLIGAINELHQDVQDISGEVYDFNMSQKTVQVASGAHTTVGETDMHALLNADASVGKIYGFLYAVLTANLVANDAIATLTIPGLDTETAYDVAGYEIQRYAQAGEGTSLAAYLHFNVGNTVEIRTKAPLATTASGRCWINLPPCLLFLKDLGD